MRGADTHSRTNGLQVPAGDVLLHAGDFTNIGLPKDVERFRKFLDHLPHPHKVGQEKENKGKRRGRRVSVDGVCCVLCRLL